MLEQLDEGLWVVAAPHSFLGLRVGTRMTVVRFADGSLWIHSPIRLDPALRAAVDTLGEVAHIVAPSLYHHVYAGDWAEAYPRALVHAPAGLRRKRPDLRIDADFESGPSHSTWSGTLIPHTIDGSRLQETVFVHPPSRSVISSDLTENFATSDHWPTRLYLKATGIHGRIGLARPLHWLYRDHKAARRSIDVLLEHQFNRLIIAHGDVIAENGPQAVRQTFEGWLR